MYCLTYWLDCSGLHMLNTYADVATHRDINVLQLRNIVPELQILVKSIWDQDH